MTSIKTPKKLIEVALPLDAINEEAALRKRKAPGGYPTTLHKWWAQRPVAAARAVIFAQMVNDPGGERGYFTGMTKAQAAAKREELFEIINDLVRWENTNNKSVLDRAQTAIRASWEETCRLNKSHPQASEIFNPECLPVFHDPFAGSGAIPLEALRLGFESYASDLNPVAVTINKAMIEIPPKFAGRAPVGDVLEETNSAKKKSKGLFAQEWHGTQGLAEDVRRYGTWMRAEAEKRIGHLYPKIAITPEMVAERPDLASYKGEELTVIAWLWARTVKSPNPAFSHVDVPLASTFILSSKAGKEAYVQPIIDGDSYRFTIKIGTPPASAKAGTSAGKRGGFFCLLSDSPIGYNYIRDEGTAGRMRSKLMAIVAEGAKGRVYISPTDQHEEIVRQVPDVWKPEVKLHVGLTH
jgi:putative DNA methylase